MVSLPLTESRFLAERGIAYTATVDTGMICVVLTSWKLPTGYNRPEVDLLLRLPPGFPDLAPDMWWVDPAIRLADGREVEATQVSEVYLGRTWQRWSRHFAPGRWRSGIDNLETFLAQIKAEMVRSAQRGV